MTRPTTDTDPFIKDDNANSFHYIYSGTHTYVYIP